MSRMAQICGEPDDVPPGYDKAQGDRVLNIIVQWFCCDFVNVFVMLLLIWYDVVILMILADGMSCVFRSHGL